jgi:hypothetical protein
MNLGKNHLTNIQTEFYDIFVTKNNYEEKKHDVLNVESLLMKQKPILFVWA